jgi:Fe-S cluster assembly scaffold protein SufB
LPLGMCDACLRGKTNQVPVPKSVEAQMSPASVFEVMHMDIKSLQGNQYTTFVVDEGSGKHYVYHSESNVDKEEVVEQFVKEEARYGEGADC